MSNYELQFKKWAILMELESIHRVEQQMKHFRLKRNYFYREFVSFIIPFSFAVHCLWDS